MKRLLTTAVAIALLAPTAALAAPQDNAGFVAIVATYRDKCGTPPDAVAKMQLALIKQHDYTNDMAMDALIDVTFQLTKMKGGIKTWCSAMADGFKENTPSILEKLKAAK